MPTMTELIDQRTKLSVAAKELNAKAETENRDFTPEESKQFDEYLAAVEALSKRIERQSRVTELDTKSNRLTPASTPIDANSDRPKVPAIARRYVPLNYLRQLRTVTDLQERQNLAYAAGMWVRGCIGNPRARQWCSERGIAFQDIEVRAQEESTLTAGGYLVPDQVDNAMIDLKEQRGIFRQYARVSPMTSDKKVRMRRTGGLTAYFTAEGGTITESQMAWDRIVLVAKDLGCIALVTNDLNEDATISIGDALIGEMAYAFADKEDECGFNGDGTSTYGGIIGVREALKNLSSTIAEIAGLYVGTGNAYSELVIADFENVVALLPQYADTSNARWFVHRSFYYSTMLRVALASGGVTKEEVISGQRTPMYLGYPVAFSQVMPKVEANSQVVALLGDLSLAADFGDRRQTAILFSEHATVGGVSSFETNQLAVRGVQRFDINVHDVGNAHATAASEVPGPIVGLIMAAS